MERSHKSMPRKFAAALLLAGLAAVPGAARAWTTTVAFTATMEALNTCSVTGATVNLGAYRTTQTWGDIGVAMGYWNGTYVPGTVGQEGLDFGSITCDAGVPYTLSIRGTGADRLGVSGFINLFHNGKAMSANIFIKKLGGATMPDSSVTYSGAGTQVNYTSISGTGSGAPQELKGSAVMMYGEPYTTGGVETQPLSLAGTIADNLTYTLNF